MFLLISIGDNFFPTYGALCSGASAGAWVTGKLALPALIRSVSSRNLQRFVIWSAPSS